MADSAAANPDPQLDSAFEALDEVEKTIQSSIDQKPKTAEEILNELPKKPALVSDDAASLSPEEELSKDEREARELKLPKVNPLDEPLWFPAGTPKIVLDKVIKNGPVAKIVSKKKTSDDSSTVALNDDALKAASVAAAAGVVASSTAKTTKTIPEPIHLEPHTETLQGSRPTSANDDVTSVSTDDNQSNTTIDSAAPSGSDEDAPIDDINSELAKSLEEVENAGIQTDSNAAAAKTEEVTGSPAKSETISDAASAEDVKSAEVKGQKEEKSTENTLDPATLKKDIKDTVADDVVVDQDKKLSPSSADSSQNDPPKNDTKVTETDDTSEHQAPMITNDHGGNVKESKDADSDITVHREKVLAPISSNDTTKADASEGAGAEAPQMPGEVKEQKTEPDPEAYIPQTESESAMTNDEIDHLGLNDDPVPPVLAPIQGAAPQAVEPIVQIPEPLPQESAPELPGGTEETPKDLQNTSLADIAAPSVAASGAALAGSMLAADEDDNDAANVDDADRFPPEAASLNTQDVTSLRDKRAVETVEQKIVINDVSPPPASEPITIEEPVVGSASPKVHPLSRSRPKPASAMHKIQDIVAPTAAVVAPTVITTVAANAATPSVPAKTSRVAELLAPKTEPEMLETNQAIDNGESPIEEPFAVAQDDPVEVNATTESVETNETAESVEGFAMPDKPSQVEELTDEEASAILNKATNDENLDVELDSKFSAMPSDDNNVIPSDNHGGDESTVLAQLTAPIAPKIPDVLSHDEDLIEGVPVAANLEEHEDHVVTKSDTLTETPNMIPGINSPIEEVHHSNNFGSNFSKKWVMWLVAVLIVIGALGVIGYLIMNTTSKVLSPSAAFEQFPRNSLQVPSLTKDIQMRIQLDAAGTENVDATISGVVDYSNPLRVQADATKSYNYSSSAYGDVQLKKKMISTLDERYLSVESFTYEIDEESVVAQDAETVEQIKKLTNVWLSVDGEQAERDIIEIIEIIAMLPEDIHYQSGVFATANLTDNQLNAADRFFDDSKIYSKQGDAMDEKIGNIEAYRFNVAIDQSELVAYNEMLLDLTGRDEALIISDMTLENIVIWLDKTNGHVLRASYDYNWGDSDVSVTTTYSDYNTSANVQAPQNVLTKLEIQEVLSGKIESSELIKESIEANGASDIDKKLADIEAASVEPDTQRQLDITAIHESLEILFDDVGFYPTIAQLADEEWVSTNLTGIDSATLSDPSSGRYTYVTTTPSCDNIQINCVEYILSADLEEDGRGLVDADSNNADYVIKSLNLE